MTRRNNNVRRQYTVMHTLCSIVFCMLIFIYLYSYQGNIMALAQHILSGGATTYDNFIGASVITFVMFIVHTLVYSILRLDRWFYWLTYLPSFLILAVLTDVTPDSNGGVYNSIWLWLVPLIIVVYVLMVRLFSEVDGLGKDGGAPIVLFSKPMWVNLLSVTIMMLLVVEAGNTDVTFHHRVLTENHIIAGEFDEALDVGKEYTETDESLTMLRAYALAKKGQLSERLFEYPIVGGSAALRPNGNDITALMIHNSDIIKFINSRGIDRYNVSADYILCADLLDCRIDKFCKHLSKYYIIDSRLPKHYKEALLLASQVSRGDTVSYADSVMTADYYDFIDLKKKNINNNELTKAMKERFAHTYWYYYFLNRKY